MVNKIVSGETLSGETLQSQLEEKSILLIDEVDVFFSNGYFGKTYNAVETIYNDSIATIQKYIWQEVVKNPNLKEDELKSNALTLIDWGDKMMSNLKNSNMSSFFLDKMITNALDLNKNYAKTYKDQFKIINDRIHYRLDDKFVTSRYIGYYNSFAYLKLIYDKYKSFEGVELNKYSFGYLMISCGSISYSEIPNSFESIYGVSGSLSSLSEAEKSLMTYYKIENISSFHGKQILKFDKNSDFKILSSIQSWHEKIVEKARRTMRDKRSVLIYFADEAALIEFRKYSGELDKPCYITLNNTYDGETKEKHYSDDDVNRLIGIEFAGCAEKTTLLTKEFGRGVDFQASAKVVEHGGTHVIQTFFSLDIKEEVQIKGRTCRKDEPGSYDLIICLEHLQKNLSESVTEASTYDDIDELRKNKLNNSYKDKLTQIEKNKENHEATIDFYKRALSQCNNSNRIEFTKEIVKKLNF